MARRKKPTNQMNFWSLLAPAPSESENSDSSETSEEVSSQRASSVVPVVRVRERRPSRSSKNSRSSEPMILGSFLAVPRDMVQEPELPLQSNGTSPSEQTCTSTESRPPLLTNSNSNNGPSSQQSLFVRPAQSNHSQNHRSQSNHSQSQQTAPYQPPVDKTPATPSQTPPVETTPPVPSAGGGGSNKQNALQELKAIQERLSRALAERTTRESQRHQKPSSPPAGESSPSLPQKLLEQSPWKSKRITVSPKKSEEKEALTIKELYRLVNPTLKDLGSIRIKGEVSNRKIPGSRHMYFSLKDDGGVLNMAFFRQYHKPNQFLPQNGMEVVCRGELVVYESRSNFQMIVHEIEPLGVGALFEAFERLKGRLTQEGLFAPERKKPIPAFPRRIGLVTSPTGAALRDMLKVFRRRAPSISLLLAGSQVQGEGAAAQVASAIEALNRQEGLDLIIVGRGGGSMEDLWTFNEEPVVRAIAASRYPVISGVGHETDTTLSDLVADLRAPTPSAAAERASQNSDEGILADLEYFEERLEDLVRQQLQDEQVRLLQLRQRLGSPERQVLDLQRKSEQYLFRMQTAIQKQWEHHREQLQKLEKRLEHRNPVSQLHEFRQRWLKATQALENQQAKQMESCKHQFALLVRRLNDLSPLNVLQRGYSLAYTDEGKVLQSTSQVQTGDTISLQLQSGQLKARVEEITEESKEE